MSGRPSRHEPGKSAPRRCENTIRRPASVATSSFDAVADVCLITLSRTTRSLRVVSRPSSCSLGPTVVGNRCSAPLTSEQWSNDRGQDIICCFGILSYVKLGAADRKSGQALDGELHMYCSLRQANVTAFLARSSNGKNKGEAVCRRGACLDPHLCQHAGGGRLAAASASAPCTTTSSPEVVGTVW